MGAALDQSLLVELIQYSDEGDGLQIEPGCDLGLADTLVTGNIEHDRRLSPRDREPGLPCLPVEAPLDQPGDIVDQESEIAPEPRLRLGLLDPCFSREIAWRDHRPDLTRRHDAPPRGLVSAYPKEPPARATAGRDARPSGRSVRGRDRRSASCRASAIEKRAARRRSKCRAGAAAPSPHPVRARSAARRTAQRRSSS